MNIFQTGGAAIGLAAALTAMPASAQSARTGIEAGDVLLRARAILVAPNERSSDILPAFPGEQASVDNSVMPELDLTYMATDHLGLELIASTTRHSASGRSGTTGSIGKLASTWVLPPTLTAQYHFNSRGAVRPYVGAGINYTLFWHEKASDELKSSVGDTQVHMSDSVGWAGQIGVDLDLTPKLFLNLDLKYIDIDTTAQLRTTAAGTQSVRLNLDPLVFGIGLGLRL